MQKLDQKKEEKIARGLSDIDSESAEKQEPEEAEREEKKRVAQELRNNDALDLNGEEIGEIVGRSDTWVYEHTEKPE